MMDRGHWANLIRMPGLLLVSKDRVRDVATGSQDLSLTSIRTVYANVSLLSLLN